MSAKVCRDFLRRCPLCLGSDLSVRYDFKDFQVISCKNCENAWRSNMYDRAELNAIYCDSEYERHPYFDRDRTEEAVAANPRYANYLHGLRLIETYTPPGRLLDVGSGSGTVLAMAKKRGWDSVGVEMSPGLARSTSEELRVPVHIGTFEEASFEDGSFSAITFWDVIEHVIDPVSCLRKARELLKDSGIALFCTPDEQSLLATIGRLMYSVGYAYPALALHPRNHTYFFGRKGFQKTLRAAGFEIVRTYSQEAFFEHSPLASQVQKVGIRAIEAVASVADRRYEMVMVGRAV